MWKFRFNFCVVTSKWKKQQKCHCRLYSKFSEIWYTDCCNYYDFLHFLRLLLIAVLWCVYFNRILCQLNWCINIERLDSEIDVRIIAAIRHKCIQLYMYYIIHKIQRTNRYQYNALRTSMRRINAFLSLFRLSCVRVFFVVIFFLKKFFTRNWWNFSNCLC